MQPKYTTSYPSTVYGLSAGDPDLAAAFPTLVPAPEHYVYEYVRDACGVPVTDPLRPQDRVEVGVRFPLSIGNPLTFPITFNTPPAALLYADPYRSLAATPIQVVRGWPAYPGILPAIGIAVGPEPEDETEDGIGGGYAGQSVLYYDDGSLFGSCDYYSEPYSSTIVVELIHENRDERDRLHDELRRILFPLRSKLLARDPKLRKVHMDAERTELSDEISNKPFLIYASIFTVQVWGEMLVAENVTGPDGHITAIDTAATGLPSPVNPTTTLTVPVAGGIFFDPSESGLLLFPTSGAGLVFQQQVALDFPQENP